MKKIPVLWIGAAGVGKTTNFLYQNLEYACACGMSFVTTDTKGDLYRNYGSIAKEHYGYDVAVIAFSGVYLEAASGISRFNFFLFHDATDSSSGYVFLFSEVRP